MKKYNIVCVQIFFFFPFLKEVYALITSLPQKLQSCPKAIYTYAAKTTTIKGLYCCTLLFYKFIKNFPGSIKIFRNNFNINRIDRKNLNQLELLKKKSYWIFNGTNNLYIGSSCFKFVLYTKYLIPQRTL